jgi:4-hydroxy-4-methyl-2-oxoglutarate aldolase
MEFNSKHPLQGKIVQKIERPSKSAIDALSLCSSAFVLDRLGKFGAMSHIHPLSTGMKLCGAAVTALGPDQAVRKMAIDLAVKGDVLVVAAGGSPDYACFGEDTARRMMGRGIVGIVIDGATRDALALRKLGFATFVKGVTPKNCHYPISAEYGAVNVPVVCAGLLVNPGDIIFGDDDGVIVVPREWAENFAARTLNELRDEAADRARKDFTAPCNVSDELKARGYRFE